MVRTRLPQTIEGVVTTAKSKGSANHMSFKDKQLCSLRFQNKIAGLAHARLVVDFLAYSAFENQMG